MKISERLKEDKVAFSLEFFPPKTERGVEKLYDTVSQLKQIDPAFCSVTYGAGGGSRDKTIEIATYIKEHFGIEVMAHLTCVGADKKDISNILDELRDKNIDNVLALRGDLPEGLEEFVPPADGFAHASELVEFIKQKDDFCIAVAGYPEGHVEAPDKETDFSYLKKKIEAGGEFVVTQLFFENSYFFDFVDYMKQQGVNVPILPGILPVTNLKKMDRIINMSHATFPRDMAEKFDKIKDDDKAVWELGVELASEQVKSLIQGGVKGIHFYTLNKPEATLAIINNLKRNGII